jgi:hypothetical protein
MTGVRLLLKSGLNLGGQTLKAAPHVRHSGSDPDPRCRVLSLEREVHQARRLSTIVRINARSASPSTEITALHGKSIRIELMAPRGILTLRENIASHHHRHQSSLSQLPSRYSRRQ